MPKRPEIDPILAAFSVFLTLFHDFLWFVEILQIALKLWSSDTFSWFFSTWWKSCRAPSPPRELRNYDTLKSMTRFYVVNLFWHPLPELVPPRPKMPIFGPEGLWPPKPQKVPKCAKMSIFSAHLCPKWLLFGQNTGIWVYRPPSPLRIGVGRTVSPDPLLGVSGSHKWPRRRSWAPLELLLSCYFIICFILFLACVRTPFWGSECGHTCRIRGSEPGEFYWYRTSVFWMISDYFNRGFHKKRSSKLTFCLSRIDGSGVARRPPRGWRSLKAPSVFLNYHAH